MSSKFKRKFKEFLKNCRILKHPFAIVFYVIMWIYVFSLIIPALWVFVSTFKDSLQFRFNHFGLPDPFTFENYANVFSKMYIQNIDPPFEKVYVPKLMLNGLSYSILNVISANITDCFVAYACTKYDRKFGKFLYAFAIKLTLLKCISLETKSQSPSLISALAIFLAFSPAFPKSESALI